MYILSRLTLNNVNPVVSFFLKMCTYNTVYWAKFSQLLNRCYNVFSKGKFKIGPKWILTENYRVAERNYLRLLHTLKTTQCALWHFWIVDTKFPVWHFGLDVLLESQRIFRENGVRKETSNDFSRRSYENTHSVL